MRHLLRLEAGFGFPMRVAVVDFQFHLGLKALRWAGAFVKPQIVANSTLAGSKFSNAYARNMLYGILEEVHRSVPLVRVDQHVDDLAQCAVGHQTAVIKHIVEAAEIITFACDRLRLVISPKLTICCSDVKTETLLRRGLVGPGIHFGVTRRTRDLGFDSGGSARRAVGLTRKRLCKAAKRSKRLAVIRRHTKKAPSLHRTNIWPCSSLGAAGMGIAPSTMQGIRSRAADAMCPKFGGCVTPGIAIGLPHNADPAVQARIECVKQWLVFWHNADEFVRTRACGALRLSLEQLRDRSSRPHVGGRVCPV